MLLPWRRLLAVKWRRDQGTSREQETARRLAEVTASRRIIVDAYEVERRRIERDLHDGTQQYLVAAAMQVGEALLSPSLADDPQLKALLEQASGSIARSLEALRHTIRGVHPQLLVQQGLVAALQDVAVATGSSLQVRCPNPLPELAESVAAAAYFFACEAISNAVKYAPGADITVLLAADERLIVSVVDTGPGGAVLRPGHGLEGMKERLNAFDAELELFSPLGGPTQVVARIPMLLERGEPGIVL